MTRLVSSYSDSFASGTLLMHSGDSANASSALQLLETRMADHEPDSRLVSWLATAKGAAEKSASRQGKKRFAAESPLANSINSSLSFCSRYGHCGNKFRSLRQVLPVFQHRVSALFET